MEQGPGGLRLKSWLLIGTGMGPGPNLGLQSPIQAPWALLSRTYPPFAVVDFAILASIPTLLRGRRLRDKVFVATGRPEVASRLFSSLPSPRPVAARVLAGEQVFPSPWSIDSSGEVGLSNGRLCSPAMANRAGAVTEHETPSLPCPELLEQGRAWAVIACTGTKSLPFCELWGRCQRFRCQAGIK